MACGKSMKCEDAKMMNPGRLLHCVLLAFAMLPLQGCAKEYSAKAIEAWVVDADSGQPLKGVAVVAHWELNYGLEGGASYQLNIMETVTDKNGRFTFPAWGPTEIPKELPSETRMKNNDPEIMFFKSGYRTLEIRNERPIGLMSGHGSSVRTSDWNGKSVQLRKLENSPREYAFLLPNLYFVEFGKDCEWKYLPRMIVAISKEQKRLRELNIRFPKIDLEINSLPRQGQCGSAKEFFEEYLK